MKKLILIALMVAGLAAFKCNSIRHISGIVYGMDDKLPIAGASVKVDGTFAGTVTNANGKYDIDVPDGKNSLVFSYAGFKTKTVKLDTSNKLDVYLESAKTTLNEVVVTGYTTQQKKDVTGSVATITPADATSMPPAVAAGMLKSKAAGVVVMQKNITLNAPSLYYNSNTYTNDDESYQPISENGFNNPKDNPLSTFSVDVDGASYSNVRRFINNGQLPPADAVRVEEMINYFKYNLPGPTNGDPVAIYTELSSAPWNQKHLLVRIGLKARTVDMNNIPPSNLVFLLDVSGSMGEPNKLPLVKASMKMLVDELRPQDRVAIVTYSGQAGVKLPSTPGSEKQKIKDAIDDLYAGGSTAGGAGIKLAYQIARENFVPNGNNRIIMATDGDFNVGDSSDGDMETLITGERYSNVPITIMGFGMGNLKDSKMEILADKGDGNYAYIDNLTEARKTLVTKYGGTMYMVAKDVKLQVEFNPAIVQSYRLVGYEDRMLNKEDFNNDQKDAGDMGSGHTVTALYEIVPVGVNDDYSPSVDPLKYQKSKDVHSGTYSDELMTVKFRYKQPVSDQSKLSVSIVKNNPVSFNSTSPDFRFASAVAEFGMLLRNSQFKQNGNYDQVVSIAKAARGEDEDGYRSEFVRLVETAKPMVQNSPYLTKY
ncbi:MAG TPA: von Willebrand factor type A domain-containing protein [Mucilaginibacter sp.]|nr:von Willebrand factor type A domain-containing protein [Mucilaginibacter sp.]